MTLSFKPQALVLLCSAGLLATSGVLYVKSRAPETITQPAAQTAAQPAPPAPAPAPAATAPAAAPVTTTYTTAQIDQWVAPVALYPDNLLSQVLMAATYPTNVMQAVEWSHDNPSMQGDPAVQAVANQPWDPSVKSLVAFPALLTLMGENPQWVQDLGNAFLAQPQDVMNSVQKLRALAQQTGALKSTPQQKVTVTAAPANSSSTTTTTQSAPATTQVIKIESADPQVVYVPTYNPSTVYGTWPNTAYPPVYLPPPPGEQFGNSFMNGLGFSLGVATTYALFSNIDWDDDDHYHGNGNWNGNGYNHNGDNINIDVNNFNRISGEHLNGKNVNWQHNPTYRNNTPYPNNSLNQQFHRTNVAGGLSATQNTTVNRDSQRQAAMNQFEKKTGTSARPAAGTKDAQRKAASQQMRQTAKRNDYRGYDNQPVNRAKNQRQQPSAQQQQQRRERAQQQQRTASNAAQRPQRVQNNRANALSGNDSRSPSWEAQRQRGMESRNTSARNNQAREGRGQSREMRRR